MAKRGVTEYLQVFSDWRIAAFDLESDLIIGLDGDGNIQVVNPAFERVLGYREASVLHKPLIHFVSIRDLSRFIRIFYDRDKESRFNLLHCWTGEVTMQLVDYAFKPDWGLVILRESRDATASR